MKTKPKPPKRALYWGLYNKRGWLLEFHGTKRAAAFYMIPDDGEYVARFEHVPLATGRRAKP